MNAVENKLLTLREVSALFNIKESWIRSKVFSKEIPFIKLGHLLRFDLSELDRWLKSKKINESDAD